VIIGEEYDHPATPLPYLINDNYEPDTEDDLVDVNGEEIQKKEATRRSKRMP
jgi:hypothetical protein